MDNLETRSSIALRIDPNEEVLLVNSKAGEVKSTSRWSGRGREGDGFPFFLLSSKTSLREGRARERMTKLVQRIPVRIASTSESSVVDSCTFAEVGGAIEGESATPGDSMEKIRLSTRGENVTVFAFEGGSVELTKLFPCDGATLEGVETKIDFGGRIDGMEEIPLDIEVDVSRGFFEGL